MSISTLLALMGAGALGVALRALLIEFVSKIMGPSFLGTLAANVFGCVAFGLFFGLTLRDDSWGVWRPVILTGLLGGFTTFSGFAMDNVVLLEGGQWGRAVANVAFQVVVGTLALWGGYRLVA